MVLLKVLSGETAGYETVARRFPFVVGRGAAADLRLELPGVWDPHLRLVGPPREPLRLCAEGDALTLVNGQRVQETRLRNGDVIEAGAAKIQFWLSPLRQRTLRWREGLTWLGLAALTGLQVFAALSLAI